MYSSTCALYKKNCNAAYRAQSDNCVPKSFKEYIDKIYALFNSKFLKN